MQSKAKGKGNLSVLMDYAGRRRVLTYLSWVLSAVSALTALVPFIFVWLIVREVIEANGNFAAVQGSEVFPCTDGGRSAALSFPCSSISRRSCVRTSRRSAWRAICEKGRCAISGRSPSDL